MNKSFTFLLSLAAMMLPTSMLASDYVIPCNGNSGVVIEQSGVFDRLNQNIGNTSADTFTIIGGRWRG